MRKSKNELRSSVYLDSILLNQQQLLTKVQLSIQLLVHLEGSKAFNEMNLLLLNLSVTHLASDLSWPSITLQRDKGV